MLEAIREPVDLRLRDEADLKQIADELRSETINAVAVTGGHLGAGLAALQPLLEARFEQPVGARHQHVAARAAARLEAREGHPVRVPREPVPGVDEDVEA